MVLFWVVSRLDRKGWVWWFGPDSGKGVNAGLTA
jgi:hypothetical protein